MSCPNQGSGLTSPRPEVTLGLVSGTPVGDKPLSHIEIITIGDELVEGRLIDSNAGHLSQRLTFEGLQVVRHVSVGDVRGQIIAALRESAERSDAVIVTGGLGPTTDDLTAECAAEAFGRSLARSEEALVHLTSFFEARGRKMAPNNLKQADLPDGAGLLPNPWGTAVGFSVDHGACRLYFMPGVPREMSNIFEATVAPDLRARLPASPALVATLRVFGIGESDVGHALDGLGAHLPEGLSLTVQYRASFPEIHVRLLLRGPADVGEGVLAGLKADALGRLGHNVFSDGGLEAPELAEVLLAEARAAGVTLATAESCTGGMVGALLTAIPGSSDAYVGGAVAYANTLKIGVLGVPAALIEAHGAVSAEVAEAMAAGARERFGADYAVSVTGIAGPGGGGPDKPVGTVWFAWAGPDGVTARGVRLFGDRGMVRRQAVMIALEGLLALLGDD